MDLSEFDGHLPGYAHIDRALEVAKAGGHTVLLLGGQARLVYQMGLGDQADREHIYAFTDCPCGYRFNKYRECFCTEEQIIAHAELRPSADITVEVPPLERREVKKVIDRLLPQLTITTPAMEMLEHAVEATGLDVLDACGICEVARTISRMEDSDKIQIEHMSEAIQYRKINLF